MAMKKSDFYSFLKQIPKAELHIHLEAVVSFSSVKKMFKAKFGREMTDADKDDYFKYDDLSGFIRAFLKVQDLFQTVDDFDIVFKDFAKYLEKNGITYCEVHFAPSAFIKKGFDFGAMMKCFQKNIKQVQKEKNITIRLICDVSRTFGLENAEQNFDLLNANRIPELIGIGLGGDERRGPSAEFGPVFNRARAAGLHCVAHAGEDVEPFSIWDAINILHAERIGHGITAMQDDKLIAYLKDTQLPLEICPTSNVFTKKVVTKIENHPIRAFYDRGVMVTVNTDDPVFFGVELLDEYWNLYSKMHFTLDEIKQIVINSYTASFMDADGKKKAVASVKKEWSSKMPPTV